MTTANYATTIATHAIDTTHGCHLNTERNGGSVDGPLAFLTEAAEFMNIDPDVVAEVGVMPLPVGIAEDTVHATTVTYADGSAIRFGWDDEGFAEVMDVLPSVGADAEATYR